MEPTNSRGFGSGRTQDETSVHFGDWQGPISAVASCISASLDPRVPSQQEGVRFCFGPYIDEGRDLVWVVGDPVSFEDSIATADKSLIRGFLENSNNPASWILKRAMADEAAVNADEGDRGH